LTIAAVYRREKPQQPMPVWSESFDVIISTSGENLENLRQSLVASGQEKLLQLPLLIISERMLHLAITQGFSGALLLANGASNAAIIERLIQWKTTT
ncbi:MAG: uroporphyrinogen-III synthase, partial [Gammaproteobacteria bacterium]|nr:uroporphyrinogen-III synthase [Gammaproteobacteria bacterium]